jgi:hypothetical protein
VNDVAERLRRMRRPAPASASEALDLDRLEASLALETVDGLSLKDRLQRLVASAAQGRFAKRATPLDELVAGRSVQNEKGECLVVDAEVPLETSHGDVPLSRVHAVLPETVGILTGLPELGAFDLLRAVFLDTETTGLAGGTGTAAFLVGIGFVDGDRFRVRQYVMRDYHEEPALLHELGRDLARFEHVVTFNGKMFDLPLLETRYRMNRARFPLADAAHLDLLHPARRLWKMRLESCRLQSLEGALLGLRRYGDISGEEIPRIYFEYVRSRVAGVMPRVLEHNRLDVVSLAALAIVACQWIEQGQAEDPRDVLSLARVLERAELYERSEAEYKRATAASAQAVRVPALLRLADHAKRAGDYPAALGLWEQAAAAGDALALRELAIHHEHRSRDFEAALAAADRGLALSGLAVDPPLRRAADDFQRRRSRLLRKLAGRRRPQA